MNDETSIPRVWFSFNLGQTSQSGSNTRLLPVFPQIGRIEHRPFARSDLLQHPHQDIRKRHCPSFAVFRLILFEPNQRPPEVNLAPLDLLSFTQTDATVIQESDQWFEIDRKKRDKGIELLFARKPLRAGLLLSKRIFGTT